MKILVIGAGSFSGRAFCDLARARGHEVLAMGRPEHDLNYGLPWAAFKACVNGWRNVVNFAALNMVAESWEHGPAYYETNVVGVSHLARFLAATACLERFVQISTPEVYGATGEFLREGAAFNPSTPYANSRAAADRHLQLLHRERGFPVLFTRTVNVYGPGQQLYRIIPKAALCALRGERLPLHGGGTSTRSFIHIRDAAAAYLAVLERGRPGETYHCATPIQIRIRDLVRHVCERLGVALEDVVESVPDRLGKDMNYQLDDSKIRRELGWTDTIPLAAGLDETLAWVRGLGGDLTTEYQHKQ